PTICAVGSPRVCQSPSVLWLEDPLSPPPASEFWTLPRLVDPAALPWLLVPSSLLWPGSPLAVAGSLVPVAPPWSAIDHPAPRHSTPPASPHSSILCCSGSTEAFRIHASMSVAGTFCFTLALRILLVTLAHRLSATCSTAFALPPPWLLPPSAPPWVGITSVAWVPPGTTDLKSLLLSPWLLPPSDPPWLLLFPPWLLPLSSQTRTL
ncbi:hypothetical protein M9458_018251, partial [Cirrhinus mrigala]